MQYFRGSWENMRRWPCMLAVLAVSAAIPAGRSGLADAVSTGDNRATPQLVRFAALGDTGHANCAQYVVAQALKQWCTNPAHPCDFILLHGDNIYPSGAATCTDAQFDTKFEDPYGAAQRLAAATCGRSSWDNRLDIPFYVALGNHDYGNGGTGYLWSRARHEYHYADLTSADCRTPTRSGKFQMLGRPGGVTPSPYYAFIQKHVHFFAFDTPSMTVDRWLDDPGYGNGTGRQVNWVRQQEADLIYTAMDGDTQSTWRIAFGHHPYISNGAHGNAGSYDGLSCATRPWSCGARVKAAVERMCRHGIDLYLSGHDHNLQSLWAKCDSNHPERIVEFIVSGAGSSLTRCSGAQIFCNNNPGRTRFQRRKLGFAYIAIADRSLTAQFIDASTGCAGGCPPPLFTHRWSK